MPPTPIADRNSYCPNIEPMREPPRGDVIRVSSQRSRRSAALAAHAFGQACDRFRAVLAIPNPAASVGGLLLVLIRAGERPSREGHRTVVADELLRRR